MADTQQADIVVVGSGVAGALVAYELARAGLISPHPPRTTIVQSNPANVQALDHLFERAVRVLDRTGYLKPKSRQAMLLKLRRVMFDLGLTNNDARILGGILAQVEWGLGKKTEVRSQNKKAHNR